MGAQRRLLPLLTQLLTLFAYLGTTHAGVVERSARAPVGDAHSTAARRAVLAAFPGAQAVHGGILLPIQPRHNVARGRGLLRSGVLPVDGSVNEVG